jgi:DedD protein
MGLLSSLFSRSQPSEGAAGEADNADNVAQARTRARQRLMGAVVLVGVGIIGFPLLFETQPRPIAVDVPIEIPRKENAPPLALPTARTPASRPPVVPPEPVRSAEADKPATAMITETPAEAGLTPARPASKPASAAKAAPSVTPPATPPKVVAKADEKPGAPPEPRSEPKPESKPEPKPTVAKPAAEASDAARAQALLEGKAGASPPAAAERFIVQIGAFADPVLARQTRLKVERLGLVTYTHVAKTPDGERIRVRVGPMGTRADADKVAAKLKAAGLPAAILTL